MTLNYFTNSLLFSVRFCSLKLAINNHSRLILIVFLLPVVLKLNCLSAPMT